jgi:hypothetical protein
MLFGPQGDGSQGRDGTTEKLKTKCYNTAAAKFVSTNLFDYWIMHIVVLFNILRVIL